MLMSSLSEVLSIEISGVKSWEEDCRYFEDEKQLSIDSTDTILQSAYVVVYIYYLATKLCFEARLSSHSNPQICVDILRCIR